MPEQVNPRDAEVYIGDAVYASFDGYHVWLRTERETRQHFIALDLRVYETLKKFAESAFYPEQQEPETFTP